MNTTIKEILIIVTVSIFLALLFNWKYAVKPLPWVYQPIAVESVSNESLNNLLNSTVDTAQMQLPTTVIDTTSKNLQVDSTKIKQQARLDSIKKAKQLIADSLKKANAQTTTTTSEPTADAGKLPMAVNYEQVQKLMNNPNVLFIDARKPDEHNKGNIKGSINIDIQEIQGDPAARGRAMQTLFPLPKDKPIVAYCGGGACELSHEMCDLLISIGFKKVFIYLGGWNEFKEKQGLK